MPIPLLDYLGADLRFAFNEQQFDAVETTAATINNETRGKVLKLTLRVLGIFLILVAAVQWGFKPAQQ